MVLDVADLLGFSAARMQQRKQPVDKYRARYQEEHKSSLMWPNNP